MPILHYVHDPLCGWCHAVAPLVAAAADRTDLTLRLHGGGLMIDDRRRVVSASLRDECLAHDRRIAELSGQPFGAAYFDGLLRRDGLVLDSEPPIAAVLAAYVVDQRGLAMLERLQRAHFVEGRVITDPMVLTALADELGLSRHGFVDVWELMSGDPTRAHIRDARRLMRAAGGQGFPTLALETDDGHLYRLDPLPWLRRPQAWRGHLDAVIGRLG